MDTTTIKDKIKKLLALSEDGANDNESYVAFQMAQKLMAKYKLEKSDITEEEEEKCIHHKTTLSYGTRSSDHYLNELAGIIADNFCCVHYISTPKKSRTHYICFMGMGEDVKIAEEVMYAANTAIIRGYNKVYKTLCKEFDIDYIPAKFFNPAKCGYIEGYLDGLKYALDSQKEQHQEWGLVLVAPQEAKDFLADLNKIDFNHVTLVDSTYYGDGYQDGSNFRMNKKLNSPEINGVLEGN